MLVETLPPFATEAFVDAGAAVARLEEIYERNTRFLRDRFEAYVNGGALTSARASLLSVCADDDLDPCAARFASRLRLCRGAGRA